MLKNFQHSTTRIDFSSKAICNPIQKIDSVGVTLDNHLPSRYTCQHTPHKHTLFASLSKWSGRTKLHRQGVQELYAPKGKKKKKSCFTTTIPVNSLERGAWKGILFPSFVYLLIKAANPPSDLLSRNLTITWECHLDYVAEEFPQGMGPVCYI